MPVPKLPPPFPFFSDDWLCSAAVESMPAEVEGTYIRLLCRQWSGGVLPHDPTTIRLLTKLSSAQWKKAWTTLERHFPPTADGSARANPTLEAFRARVPRRRLDRPTSMR